MSIENKGQHPSFQVFVDLMTLFHISVDQFLFPDNEKEKSTRRRQLDAALDELDERDYIVMEATAKGLKEAKEAREQHPSFPFFVRCKAYNNKNPPAERVVFLMRAKPYGTGSV